MTAPKKSNAVFEACGLALFIVSAMVGLFIVWDEFGWVPVALLACLAFGTIGFRMCCVPASGNAGAARERAGADYVVRLDPDDPDAGLPRRRP